MNTPQRQICPDDEVLQELAAGIGSPELAQQTMQHVARCSECSAALRRYIKEFSDEQTPENIALINRLESSKRQWQKKLVRNLTGGRRFPWLKLVPAMAALAIVIFAVIQGPALLVDYKVKRAQSDIAATFSVRRTTEGRMPGESYSKYNPRPTVLGAENGPGLDEIPASLHDAISAANQNLDKKADPRWLQIQGLGLLWEATPSSLEKAEKDFEKARSKGLVTPSLEIDLAASYYERDSRAEHPNLQRTLNLLSEVLSKPALSKEDQASALFNLALAYEKTQAWDLAVSTWEKYLQVDSTSDWTNEAQQHLKDAKAKIHDTALVKPTDPAAFLQQVSIGALQDEVEEYQDVAIRVWLPTSFATQSPLSLNATRTLGELLEKKHSDPWLKDLVSSLRQEDLPAVKALANAFKRNGEGDHDGAIREALIAAKIFARRKNISGEFRAQLEEVNAFRRALNGSDCLARADPLLNQLLKTKYRWLQARVSLEKAECGNLLGEFEESDNDLQTSRQIAGQFNFPLLAIRDIGISAGNKHLRGNCDATWRESTEGLDIYWQKSYATQDGLYQFYSVLYQCALETGAMHVGEAFLKRAIDLRETSTDIKKNRTIEGILHLQLANALVARKEDQEADLEKKKAALLIGSKGLKPQFDLIFKLEAAEFQLDQGDAQLALGTLNPLRKALDENPDSFFSLRFNQALGNTYHKLHRLDDAEIAYQAAIKTAESALGSIKNPAERLLWLRATDESYRGLVRVLIEQKKDKEALDRWELYRSRPILQGRLPGSASDSELKRVQSQIYLISGSPRNIRETRIVYANFSDGLYIWVLQNGNITSRWVEIGEQDFENLTRDFVEKCAVENSDLGELKQLGAKLFAVLLQPVISDISPEHTVIIELDRIAYNLPIEALNAPEGWYFGEKYSVTYSPGVWMEKTLRPLERLTGQEALLLLDASHAVGAGYLPGLEAQKNAIVRLFPRNKVINTTKISWLQARPYLVSSQIIHYMGHGKPDGSGTSLDYDGNQPIRAKDFSPDLLAHSQIILLAACSGAAGKDNGLADTNNLVRVFLSAGVPSVIASHWNVDSASTSQLMVSFYKHLVKGESAAEAIYNARIEILRTKSHPYFWAGFTLTGRAS
jgi:CHAT domain-containing protein